MMTEVMAAVHRGQVWQHRNGARYQVLMLANENTERPDQYPVTVVYRNADNGTRWSRRLDDWHRSMTLVGAAELVGDKPAWISVSDRLPPEDKTVAVKLSDGAILTAWATHWQPSGDFAYWSFPHPDDDDSTEDVTHWAELPE